MTTEQIQTLYRTEPRRACQVALRQTCHLPERDRLDAIDALLGNHGTEAIRGAWQNGYWCGIVAAYSHTGDSYATTVVQVRGAFAGARSRFLVTSWGDWVAANTAKFAIA